jgi:threonylcarbamoyladenosine tRNA methylthiotransferase MtaB
VVRQVATLVENGTLEVVLTGVDITDYGKDLPGQPSLGQLVRRVLRLVPDLPRLRLTSLDPVELDRDLLRLLAEEPRLMPHLHLSLQSGDDLILKRMKRRHSRADVLRLCQEARRLRPDVVFGADLIAGFPTEDEAAFENSLSMVEACGLTHLHVFPYSPRPGTPAARMPQVDPKLRKARAARLREAGARARARFFEHRIGTTADVLVEQPGFGHSEHFAPVALAPGADTNAQPDTIVRARITGRAGDRLLGQAL